MADDEDIAALVIDNGSGMCKGKQHNTFSFVLVGYLDMKEFFCFDHLGVRSL